eukprot:408675-Amphidinium_carterae.2
MEQHCLNVAFRTTPTLCRNRLAFVQYCLYVCCNLPVGCQAKQHAVDEDKHPKEAVKEEPAGWNVQAFLLQLSSAHHMRWTTVSNHDDVSPHYLARQSPCEVCVFRLLHTRECAHEDCHASPAPLCRAGTVPTPLFRWASDTW